MTTPRKASTAAAPVSRTGDLAASSSQDVGEAPGSPAYFGESGAAGSSAAGAAPDFEMVPDTGSGNNPPGSAEYWGVDPATHAASRGPDGAALPLPTVGEPPGSPSYFGTGGGTADLAASSSQDVGEAPGSPAYFGESGAAGSSAAGAAPDFEMVPDTGPGNPPGSAEYWGVDPATHAASRGPDGAALPLPTVGEPPGSPSYFGTGGGVK